MKSAEPLDLDFLAMQTFDDTALERDVLGLFVEQARRLIAALPTLEPAQQADTAHLIQGSARGIGAWAVAREAQRYEAASPGERPSLWPGLAAAVGAADRAIGRRLATLDD